MESITKTTETALAPAMEPTQGSRPACGPEGGVGDEYDLQLHVAALFIMLITSSVAAYGPLYFQRLIAKYGDHGEQERLESMVTENCLYILKWMLWGARHFGTGVIIGTAFIHLLPGAHDYLTDPCLPDFFTQTYTALPELIAMCACLLIFTVDFLSKRFVERVERKVASARLGITDEENPHESAENEKTVGTPSPVQLLRTGPIHQLDEHFLDSDITPSTSVRTLRFYVHDVQRSDSDSTLAPSTSTSTVPIYAHEGAKFHVQPEVSEIPNEGLVHETPYTEALSEREQRIMDRQEMLSILVVEAGICFHSIFIGLTLALTTGDAFTALLISIVFHQTFEGLAIGGRLAALNETRRNLKDWKLWLCATMYGCTTPLGIAIGIAIRKDFNIAGQNSLVLAGAFDSTSAGLLLYGGLVGLLSRDFNRVDMTSCSLKISSSAIALMATGATAMAYAFLVLRSLLSAHPRLDQQFFRYAELSS